MDEIAKNSLGSIKYFKANLLRPDSYDEAMKDCELVIDIDSPFSLRIKNPQKDLVDPALKETENVLISFLESKFKNNVGYPWKVDNSKIKREFKMEFRPISDSVNEFIQQLIDNKVFNKK